MFNIIGFFGSNKLSVSEGFSVTGGVTSSYTSGTVSYMVHTFTSSDTATVTGEGEIDYLIVAGGGGGGYTGGGGAGGLLTSSKTITSGVYSIIVGAGGASGSLDASNMFKPALARGEIQCIGATTLDEYRQHIEKDGALARRFQMVMVEAATVPESIEILQNIKEKYESHHRVKYDTEAIEACVKMSERYISDRFLPDKAIDVLDEAGARVHINNIHVPDDMSGVDKHERVFETVKENRHQCGVNHDFSGCR